jgi:hypothetical protein
MTRMIKGCLDRVPVAEFPSPAIVLARGMAMGGGTEPTPRRVQGTESRGRGVTPWG